METARGFGIKLIAQIDFHRNGFPNSHWTWRDTDGILPDMKAWGEYLRGLVKQYRDDIHLWEVWSEPNCAGCNPMSHYDYAAYSRVLATASNAIHSADPSARVILGGLWLPNLSPMYVEGLFQMGVMEYIDIFGIHFYPIPGSRRCIPFQYWKPKLDEWMSYFHEKLSAECPIWITEFGIPAATQDSEFLYTRASGKLVGMTEEDQSEWFTQFIRVAKDQWNVELVNWSQLNDYYEVSHS